MNSGSRYRRNKRKKRIKAIIIISVCAVLALFAIFMITGLILSDKTTANDAPNGETKITDATQSESKNVASVNAYPLALLQNGSTFSSRLSAVPEEAKAVCVSLNDERGELLFRSSIAAHFANLSIKSDASQLSSYTNTIRNNEFYCTALLYMADPSSGKSELVGDVYSSMWSAIACEAINSGVDDVLLIPKGTNDNTDKLCALAQTIHLSNEDAIIGLAIPQSILSDENSTQLIARLADSFDYLAIDATSAPQSEEQTTEEQIENTLKKLQLQIMYHNMRVLLPNGANQEEQNLFIETVTKYNITNWQISPNQ